MAKEIVMPRLSDTMEEGKILKWHKRVGDEIHKGDVLAEIETDKANMELESYDDGVLLSIMIQEGGQAPLGVPIAMIGAAGEAPAVPAEPAPPAPQPVGNGVQLNVSAPEAPMELTVAKPSDELMENGPRVSAAEPATETSHQTPPPLPPPTAVSAPESGGDEGRLRVSPLARRIAEERGIDLRQIRGTGPGGRIVRDDVESAQPAAALVAPTPAVPTAPPVAPEPAAARPVEATPLPAAGQVVQLSRMQQTIARRMVESKQQVPHFYVTTEVDTAALTGLRKQLNGAGEPIKLSYNDFIVKAVALALADQPLLNSSWRDGSVLQHAQINVGVAVSIPNGLIVPVVHDAGNRSLRQIAAITKAIIERTRDNKLKSEDVTGATFTISNLGMFDVDEFMAIVDQPSVAILAIGSIRQQPVVVDGQLAVGERMKMTISADHRVVYGAEAAQFVQLVKRRLESPFSLLG